MPHEYECNNRRVDTQVPTQDGQIMQAQWIQFLGNGEVLTRAGEDPDEPEYMISLYLKSDYS